jgi:hypothetical protein
VFSNNIQQDVMSVLVGLLNQQSIDVGSGRTLKDQLMDLAKKSQTNDVNLNVPATSLGQGFNLDGLAQKIQEAIANKGADKPDLDPSSLKNKAKELLDQFGK